MVYENGKNTFAEKQFPHTTGALLTATINSIKNAPRREIFQLFYRTTLNLSQACTAFGLIGNLWQLKTSASKARGVIE
jgi:hypothetical protein